MLGPVSQCQDAPPRSQQCCSGPLKAATFHEAPRRRRRLAAASTRARPLERRLLPRTSQYLPRPRHRNLKRRLTRSALVHLMVQTGELFVSRVAASSTLAASRGTGVSANKSFVQSVQNSTQEECRGNRHPGKLSALRRLAKIRRETLSLVAGPHRPRVCLPTSMLAARPPNSSFSRGIARVALL